MATSIQRLHACAPALRAISVLGSCTYTLDPCVTSFTSESYTNERTSLRVGAQHPRRLPCRPLGAPPYGAHSINQGASALLRAPFPPHWNHHWQPHRAFTGQAAPTTQQPPVLNPTPSDSPPPPHGESPSRPPYDVTYQGPLSQQHKLLKRISIANTLIAVAAAPAIVTFADNISLVSRYGLAASLMFFGLITTGALHWVAHPYVHELRYSADSGRIDVRTTTLLGNSRWHSFNVDDVQPLPWNRPVATFTALGQFYYIDVYSFPDEALLRRLTPDEADIPKGFKDNEDDDD